MNVPPQYSFRAPFFEVWALPYIIICSTKTHILFQVLIWATFLFSRSMKSTHPRFCSFHHNSSTLTRIGTAGKAGHLFKYFLIYSFIKTSHPFITKDAHLPQADSSRHLKPCMAGVASPEGNESRTEYLLHRHTRSPRFIILLKTINISVTKSASKCTPKSPWEPSASSILALSILPPVEFPSVKNTKEDKIDDFTSFLTFYNIPFLE